MISRHVLRTGAVLLLVLLAGAPLAGAAVLHPTAGSAPELAPSPQPGWLAGLWAGALELVEVEGAAASHDPAPPAPGGPGDGDLSSLDGGDTTTTTDDGDRGAALDPDG